MAHKKVQMHLYFQRKEKKASAWRGEAALILHSGGVRLAAAPYRPVKEKPPTYPTRSTAFTESCPFPYSKNHSGYKIRPFPTYPLWYIISLCTKYCASSETVSSSIILLTNCTKYIKRFLSPCNKITKTIEILNKEWYYVICRIVMVGKYAFFCL